MKQSKNFYAGFSKKLEKPQNFVPIQSDYKRFVSEQEAKRTKRIPEVGAKLPVEKKPTALREDSRKRQALSDAYKKSEQKKASPKVAETKEQKPRYIKGFEKAGKPSKTKVGIYERPKSSDKQLELREKMRNRKVGFRKR